MIFFVFIIFNMDKGITNITVNINYDSLKINNKKLIKLKKMPNKGEVSALALISKYLH